MGLGRERRLTRLERIRAQQSPLAGDADAVRNRIAARLDGMATRLRAAGQSWPAPNLDDVRAMLHARLVALGMRPAPPGCLATDDVPSTL
jgi:hypothetical protein